MKTITKLQRAELHSLLRTSRFHAREIMKLEKRMGRIAGTLKGDYAGAFSDCIFESDKLDEILGMENITVK